MGRLIAFRTKGLPGFTGKLGLGRLEFVRSFPTLAHVIKILVRNQPSTRITFIPEFNHLLLLGFGHSNNRSLAAFRAFKLDLPVTLLDVHGEAKSGAFWRVNDSYQPARMPTEFVLQSMPHVSPPWLRLRLREPGKLRASSQWENSTGR